MSKVIDGIKKDLAAIPKIAKEKMHRSDLKKQVLLNLPYLMVVYFCNKAAWLWRVSAGTDASEKMISAMNGMENMFQNPIPSFYPRDILIGIAGGAALRMVVYYKAKNAKKVLSGCGIWFCPLECIILTVNNDFMDAGGYAHEQLQ